MKIGRRKPFQHFIREHRERAEMSMKKLGERMGVSEMTIHRWETYQTKVDMPTLDAIAEALPGNLEGEDLLHHPDKPTPNQLLRGQPPEVVDTAMRMLLALRKAQ